MISKAISVDAKAYKYNAFISYSHTSDGQFAPIIRSALHQFARPWNKLRALNIFLDKSSLAGDPSLSGALEKALRDSEWLLFMATPESAKSDWVMEEIKWWLANRSVEQLLIILTDGKIIWDRANNDFDWQQTTALPEWLKGKIKDEPLHIDLCSIKGSEQYSLRNDKDFRDGIAMIAAPMHDIPKDKLDGEDIIQHHKFTVIRRIVLILFLFLIIGMMVSIGLVYIKNNKSEQNLINLQANTAENAIYENFQLEALSASVKAGKHLQKMDKAWDGFMQNVIDADGWNETHGNVISKLLQILTVFNESNRLEGHSNAVLAIAVSPNCQNHERFIVSGGKDGKLIVWQFNLSQSNQAVKVKQIPRQHKGRISSISIAPDCSTIASGSDNNMIRLWQSNGTLIKEFDNDSRGNALAYSPDGNWLISGDELGKITLWNTRGDKKQSIDAYSGIQILTFNIRQCPTGEQLLLSASENMVDPLKLWKLDSQLHPVSGLSLSENSAKTKIRSVSLSPDCSIIATGHKNGTITLRSLDGKPYKTWKAHQGAVNDIDFSDDGRFIVSGGEANDSLPSNIKKINTVKLWQQDGQAIITFEGHRGAVTDVAFGHDANTLISASRDKTIRFWNVETVPVVKKFSFHTASNSADINTAGDQVAILRVDDAIEIINLKSGQRETMSNLGAFEPQQVFYFDNKVFYLDKQAEAVRTLKNEKEILFDKMPGPIKSISYSPELYLFAYYLDEHIISLTSIDGKQYDSFTGYSLSSKTLSFGKGGTLVFLSSKPPYTNLKLRKPNGTQKELQTKHQGEINQIVFAPDGNLFATASKDRLIKLWDRDGKELKTLLGHNSEVTNVAFHPSNTMLASSDFAGNIIIWSLSGRIMLRLNGDFKANIWVLKFTADGHQLVAVSQDSVTLWSFDLTELIQQGCLALQDFLVNNPNNICKPN